MERLTEKFVSNLPDEVLEKLGIADIPKEEYEIKGTNGELCRETCEKYKCDSCPVQKAIDKLAEYEDAEEQGLLLRLPCKIGDIVYSVTRDFISEYTICSIEKYNEGFFFNWRCEKGIYINVRGFTDYDIGKTIFLTKEQAEQALKQMGE